MKYQSVYLKGKFKASSFADFTAHHTGHLFHHLSCLFKLLHQTIYLCNIHACSIRGASDASIKDVEPNDLAALVNRLGVQAIFCNGATSGRLYRKYAQPLTGLEAVVLPSTSPANAAFTMPRLLDAWGTALEGYVNKP